MACHRFTSILVTTSCVALALYQGDGHCKLVTPFGIIPRYIVSIEN